MKGYAVLIALLLFLSLVVGSVNNASDFSSSVVLKYNETDYINIRPVASDADNDSLTYFFNNPLSSKGTWQTRHGDAGIYPTRVSVTDGKIVSTRNITLVIKKKEESPVITASSPDEGAIYIRETDALNFQIKATDMNKDKLSISWYIDKELASQAGSFTYKTDYYSGGNHTISAVVSDGVYNVTKEWAVTVEHFDRATLLDNFISINVKEADLVALPLPDFSAYDIYYNLSEPFNSQGKWQTTYADAGLHTAIIKIWDDKNFSAEKKIKILVENVDRSSSCVNKESYWASENEELVILLNCTDPDGDEVILFVGNLPEGVVFENNVLTWKPGFGTVTKQTFLDDIARRYHVMNKAFNLVINSSSNNITTQTPLEIRIFDTNRVPVLEYITDTKVSAGSIIHFNYSAYDPDNDTLSYTFEGTIEKDGYETKYGDVGTYPVKLTVSDGFLSDSKYAKVTVLPVNLPPSLADIKVKTVDEGKVVEIEFLAEDKNRDILTYQVTPMPKGAVIKDNKFFWTPDFDTVVGEDSKTLEFECTVSDGYFNITKKAKVTVNNINHAPAILTSSQIDGMEFYTGDTITYSVNAQDIDNDALTYTWKNGFDKPKAENTLSIQFDSTGRKEVSVAVSDGVSTVYRDWSVIIKEKPKVRLIY